MAAKSRIAHPRPWTVRLASFFYLLCPVIAVLTVGALVAGLLLESKFWLRITVVFVAALPAILLAANAISHRLCCSVCANPVFLVRKCRKHHRAKKFLGVSHRLGIAVAALIRQRFHCMYCGEKIPLEAAGPKKASAPKSPARSRTPMTAVVTAASELPPRRS
jgi:hypothetical protein